MLLANADLVTGALSAIYILGCIVIAVGFSIYSMFSKKD